MGFHFYLNYLRITIDESFGRFDAHDLLGLLASDFIGRLDVGDLLAGGHHAKAERDFELVLVRRIVDEEPIEFPVFTVVECAEIELRGLIAIRVNQELRILDSCRVDVDDFLQALSFCLHGNESTE